MNRSIFVVLAALGGVFASFTQGQVARYDGHKVVSVAPANAQQLKQVLALTDDVWSHRTGFGGMPIDMNVSPEQFAALGDLGLPVEVMIDDLQGAIDAEMAEIIRRRNNGVRAWFDNYKTWNEIRAHVEQLAAARPDLAEMFIAGQSLEGRDIFGIRITGPGGGDRPAVLYNGTQHAREWVSPMTVTYLADRLINTYDTDPRVQEIVDRIEFIIIPVVNPDGYLYSWSNNRMWRKNRRGGYGVDLNRNWGYEWGRSDGSSGNTGSQTYRGTAPFSEPATSSVRDFILANPHIAAHIDFHSYSQLVLWPWDWGTPLPPNNEMFREVSYGMRDAIFSVHGMGYTAMRGVQLYPASGTFADWTFGGEGILGWTIELRDTGQTGFLLPPDQILPTAEENFAAVMYLSEFVGLPLRMSFAASPPDIVDPDTQTPVLVNVASGAGELDPFSPRIYTRIGAGQWSSDPLVYQSGTEFEGQLPAASCGSTIEYYFEASTVDNQVMTFPANAPASVFAAQSMGQVIAYEDDVETDLGWTAGVAGDTATTGRWGRMDPEGTPAQPEDDHTPDGTQCWITDGRAGSSIGTYDVDGGVTTLISPRIDAVSGGFAGGEAYVSYWRWYSNDQGSAPNTDSMPVFISGDDGSSWILLEDVDENAGRWVQRSFRISEYVTPSDQVRLKFIARDLNSGSIVEAGVDDISVVFVGCDSCPADFNGDGVVNTLDFLAYLNAFSAGDPAADFNGDGVVNTLDFLDFLNAFSEGCP